MADIDEVHAIFAMQEAEGRRLINEERISVSHIRAEFSADMQFIGQTHLLRVQLPDGTPTREALQSAFERAYHDRFRVDLKSIRANLVNLNTSVIGRRPEIELTRLIDPEGRRATVAAALTGRRRVWFNGWHDTPVYWRDHLPADAAFSGPAIVEQMDTTIIIEPGDHVTTDREGNLLIAIGAGHA